MTVSPAVLDFGAAWIDERIEGSLVFANDGRVPVEFAVAGRAAPFDGPGSVTVPAVGDVTVRFGFRPTEEGPFERVLSLASSIHEPLEVTLRGHGVVPAIEVAEALDFGAVAIGQRLELPLAIYNEAPLPVTDFRFQLAGAGAEAFSIVREIRQIGAAGTAEFIVAFAPRAVEGSTAQLTVAPCATCSTRQVTLRGRGIDSTLVARPSPVDFGAVPLGGTSTIVVGLENRGEVPAELAEARVEGEAFFAGTASGLPVSLQRGGAVEIPVSFAPMERGELQGVLSFLDSYGGVALEVVLRGRGGGPVLVANPPAIDLGRVPVGWSGGADLVVKNLGENMPVEVTGAVVMGDAGWTVTTPALPASVGNGLQVRVTFVASGPPASAAAELVLATSLPGQPEVRVPLGVRVANDTGCRIAHVPPRVRFGLVQAGGLYVREVDLVNVGTDPCIVWDLHLDPEGASEFGLMPRPPDTELAPGERLAVPVAFWPAAASAEVLVSKLLYRTSNAAEPAGEVEVSGYATNLSLVAIPNPVEFGTIPINRVLRRPVTVTNQGSVMAYLVGVAPSAETGREFGVVPRTLPVAAGPGASFEVDYHPLSAGLHDGTLEFRVQGHPEPLLVGLRGEGAGGPCGELCEPPVPTCPPSGQGIVNHAVTWVGTAVDPNGDPVTCEWTVIQAPGPSTAMPQPPGDCTTQFIPDFVGDYVIRLRAADPLGNVGECVTHFEAIAPTFGLWVEQYWDLPNDVDLHLLHPLAGDPSLPSSWKTAPYDCFYSNKTPDWDLPGTVDDPGLDRDDTQQCGPENIRIDAPTPLQEYQVGTHYFNTRTPPPVAVTTNIYCGGTHVAVAQTKLEFVKEHVWIGTVWFGADGVCHWVPKDIHMTVP